MMIHPGLVVLDDLAIHVRASGLSISDRMLPMFMFEQ